MPASLGTAGWQELPSIPLPLPCLSCPPDCCPACPPKLVLAAPPPLKHLLEETAPLPSATVGLGQGCHGWEGTFP